MSVPRRPLVAALVAGAMLYGFDPIALRAEDAPVAVAKKDARPQWLTDALAEMKETKSPGVAIVLPEGKDAREKLRSSIETLLRQAHLSTQIHLIEAVWVVVEGRHVGAKDGETVVLLDADGARVAGAAVGFTQSEFLAGVRPLLRDGDRLAKRAKAARTPEFEKLAAGLTVTDEVKADAVVEQIAAKFGTFGPAVIEAFESEKAGSDRQMRLSWIIARVFTRRRGDQGAALERPLPFGAQWKKDVLPEPEVDPCPPCGMMARRAHDRDVLELLAQEARTTK